MRVNPSPADEPVFVEHAPVLGDEHDAQMRPYRWVPYPYRLAKWDGACFRWGSCCSSCCGFAFKPLWLLAGFITADARLSSICASASR